MILPAYNEAEALPQIKAEVMHAMRRMSYEIIVVDDGSTDGSDGDIKISHQGKWAAIRAGLAKARGNIIITMDADLQDDPRELPKLLRLIPVYDVVSGWRKSRKDVLYKRVISGIGNTLVGYHDLNAPMKVYKRHVLAQLPTHGSLLRFSLLFARKLGFTIKEVPVRHRPRLYGTSKFGVLKYIRILYDLVLVLGLFSGSGRLRRTL